MSLDAIAGFLCGWLALCAFTLHIVSSPRRRAWMTIPEYVRRGFLVVGVTFTWRSVNFFSVADAEPATLGHINAEGMIALIGLTYLVSAMAWWVFRDVLPNRWWERIEWMRKQAHAMPDAAPVILAQHEVANVARASGVATIGAGEGPEAVAREVPRRRKAAGQ